MQKYVITLERAGYWQRFTRSASFMELARMVNKWRALGNRVKVKTL